MVGGKEMLNKLTHNADPPKAREREWFLQNFGIWVQPQRNEVSGSEGWLVVKRLKDLGDDETRNHISFTTDPRVEQVWDALVECALRRKKLEDV